MQEYQRAKKTAFRGRARRQRGSTMIEFALVVIVAVPMLFGLVAVGVKLGRGIQAIQVTRDIGHMYGMAVDMSQPGAQNIVAKLGQDFSFNTTTGNAVLILSRVQKISASNCLSDTSVPCTNQGQPVFTNRLVLGKSSLRTSVFGTPPSAYVGANGDIAPNKYLQYGTVVAAGFDSVMNLAAGDYTSVVEGYFVQPDLNFLQPGGSGSTPGIYVRVFF